MKKKVDFSKKYIVDTSRPPIRPPLRTFIESFFHHEESKESILDRKAWEEYIETYYKTLKTNEP